jgi:hypothetical protein
MLATGIAATAAADLNIARRVILISASPSQWPALWPFIDRNRTGESVAIPRNNAKAQATALGMPSTQGRRPRRRFAARPLGLEYPFGKRASG